MTDTENPTDARIDIPAGTPVYGNKHVEIGIDENGNGYVECETVDGSSYRFSVSRTEVVEFTTISSENAPPAPTRPEDLIPDDDVAVPDGWSGGNVEHTGGNIWCRIFRSEHDNGYIEVMYNPRYIEGVSAGAYGPEYEWLGEIDHIELGANPMETEAVSAAKDLIERIGTGAYDERISELYR